MQEVERIKQVLGIRDEDQDGSLALLLADAASDVLTWTNRRVVPAGLEPAVRQLAVLRYNKQGIEGQTAHSEGGVSRSFADLPADLQLTIGSFRRVRVAGQ